MATYLTLSRYTPLGAKGLIKETAAGRRAALQAAIEGSGGKIIGLYLTHGKYNIVLISETPDDVNAATLQLIVQAAGVVEDGETYRLYSTQEVDAALAKGLKFRAANV